MNDFLAIKTLEFKLYLTPEQQAKIDAWLNVQRWAWNQSLQKLVEFEKFCAFNRPELVEVPKDADKNLKTEISQANQKTIAESYADCCPVLWSYSWMHAEQEHAQEWRDAHIIESLNAKERQFIPIIKPLIISRHPLDINPRSAQCPLLQHLWDEEQKIKNPKKETTTEKIDSGKLYRTWPSCDRFLPSALKQALHNTETDTYRTWGSALSALFAHKVQPVLGNSGTPAKITQGTIKRLITSWQEYKKGVRKCPRFKSKHGFNTLTDNQNGNAGVVGHDRIRIAKLGICKVKGLTKRWGDREIRSYHICKRPSGYYLMLVGQFPKVVLKPSDKAVGIDPGIARAVTLDDGRHYHPNLQRLDRLWKRLKRLQRKLARQCEGGQNWLKTKALIAKTHEKITRMRKAWQHKLSTKLAREYGAISFEDIKLQNLTRRPKAKPSEDGTHYEHNGAAAKAGLNHRFAQIGIGNLRALIKQKCDAWDREYDQPKAHYSSQECHCCGQMGFRDKKKIEDFYCLNEACGLYDVWQHADANAARNHLQSASFKGEYRQWKYPALSGSKPVERPKGSKRHSMNGKKQEATQNKPDSVEHPSLNNGEGSPKQGTIREPVAHNPSNPNKSVAKKQRKRQSAHLDTENLAQLTIWDAALETG